MGKWPLLAYMYPEKLIFFFAYIQIYYKNNRVLVEAKIGTSRLHVEL